MSRLRRGALASLATAVALLATGCGISLQSLPKIGGTSGAAYPVNAVFADVLNLPVNAQVRLGAQVIGSVQRISAKHFAADVVLSIKRGVRLPVGTTAEVRFDNPLGDEYVLLRPPSAPSASPATTVLLANSTVPETSTSTAPSVEDTFGALSLVLNGGGLNQLQTVVRELNNTFTGNQPQIHQLLGTINTAADSLAGGREAVDNALGALQGLSTQLNNNSGVITAGIDAAAPAITILAQANQNLTSLLGSLQALSQTGIRVATQSGQASVRDLRSLLPVVQQLANLDATALGSDLQTIQAFEVNTPKIAPGDYLQVSVVANVLLPNGPSTATPAAAGTSALAAAATDPSGAAVSDLLAGGLL